MKLLLGIIFGLLMTGISQSYAILSIDDNGGDCSKFGTWDLLSKTCKMNQDVRDEIIIAGNGITLDGNGHKIVGGVRDPSYPEKDYNCLGTGLTISVKKDVAVKNLLIEKFSVGVEINNSINVEFSNNKIFENEILGVYIKNSDNIRISNNKLFDNGRVVCSRILITEDGHDAIFVYSSKNVRVEKNEVTNNYGYGIVFHNSQDSLLNDNYIEGGHRDLRADIGINIQDSDRITIENNKIKNILSGLWLYDSQNNFILNNFMENVTSQAIGFSDNFKRKSSYNVVKGNYITDSGNGLSIYSGTENKITENTFEKNRNGLGFGDVTGNFVYNNNFIVNTLNAVGNMNEFTFNGRGNYWSDYSPACKDIDVDFVCDEPYPFSGGTILVNDNRVWIKKDGWKSVGIIKDTEPPSQLEPLLELKEKKIPDWVKNLFVWFGEDKVSEDEIITAIQFLIKNKIINVE